MISQPSQIKMFLEDMNQFLVSKVNHSFKKSAFPSYYSMFELILQLVRKQKWQKHSVHMNQTPCPPLPGANCKIQIFVFTHCIAIINIFLAAHFCICFFQATKIFKMICWLSDAFTVVSNTKKSNCEIKTQIGKLKCVCTLTLTQ